MPAQPLVTVLMSVFNDSEYLPESIAGVLAQTLTDFEFLVIDDGSTDDTQRLLGGFRDRRLRVVRNESNLGLTRSLKRGIELAHGCYVARIDADDIAFPFRLKQQVSFLEDHPDVAILGGACWQTDADGESLRLQRCPETDLEIRWVSLLANPFVHSTVMLRRDALLQHGLNYDESFGTAQDYDLWTRLLRHCKGANLAEPLIRYRIRAGVTRNKRQQQLLNAINIATRTMRQELPEFTATPEEVQRLISVFYLPAADRLETTERWRETVALYWLLLDVFAAKHPDRGTLRKLRQKQAAQILSSMWRTDFPNGWSGVFLRILGTYPLIPFRLSLGAVFRIRKSRR